MDARAKEIIQQGDNLFSKRMSFMSLLQEIADNFYPERANFTVQRFDGQDFAANLTTSYPILTRRELGSLVTTMLRPNDQDWFQMSVANDDRLDNVGRSWLERASKAQRRAMYDRQSCFVRATKEGDNDFVTFGQCVISVEMARSRKHLMYRCWHLRDVAWCENDEGKIDTIHRKWKPTARDMARQFGVDNLHDRVKEALSSGKDPYQTFNVRHVVVPSDYYQDGKKWNTPYVSVYIDVDNEHIIEEAGSWTKIYVIPRWQTVSGSQYAYSPATVAALPDARLIQAISLVLLEAGEKAVNPPLIAQEDVVRGDVALLSGGITWVSSEYDERRGASVRPMNLDYSGLPFGMEMRQDVKGMIMEAFYLNKINLPPISREMTAFEVGQRVSEYVRNALPLFEPMEIDYNGALCEDTFEILFRAGTFGSVFDMPQSLRGQDYMFQFESPLRKTVDKQKAQLFLNSKAMLAEAVSLDPTCGAILKAKEALRDVLGGIGTPSSWLASEAEMEESAKAASEQQGQQQLLNTLAQGGAAAEQVGKAGQALQGMQGMIE